jgi:integrase
MLFGTPDGSVFRPGHLKDVFDRAAKSAGLVPPRLRFHDLRHSFAGMLIASGIHAATILDMMGHSSITVTVDTYGHRLPGLDEEAASGLETMLQRATLSRHLGFVLGSEDQGTDDDAALTSESGA